MTDHASDQESILAAARDMAAASARTLASTEAMRRTIDALRAPSTSGNVTNVHFNLGGWFSVIAFVLALICILIQARGAFAQAYTDSEQAEDIRELRAENRRLNDYLSALYRQYPELRPENMKRK